VSSPAGAAREPAIELEDVEYAWVRGRPVLDVPRFTVARGERVFLKGPSGSGKSTLLGLVGGVLLPGRGRVRVLGQDLAALRGSARDTFRATHVGFVFQMFNLVPYLSVLENVLLPARFSPARHARAAAAPGGLAAEANRLLHALGLGDADLQGRGVTQLSIGQQQRVAAARALLGRPEVVIADEPTSSLDWDARESFLELLMHECATAGTTLLFVSHDVTLASLFDRTVALAEINRAARGAGAGTTGAGPAAAGRGANDAGRAGVSA
jgi:putative ABC transport system ATP-binding protein